MNAALENRAEEHERRVRAAVQAARDSMWNASSRADGAFEQIEGSVERWATVFRGFARDGHKATGTSYGYAEWATFGLGLVDDAGYQAKVDSESSLWVAVRDAVTETVTELGDLASSAVHVAEQVLDTVEDVANVGAWGVMTKVVMVLALAALVLWQGRKLVRR